MIPIDDLCKRDIDPFFDNIGINDDEFMRQQHEIDSSDIAGYPEDTGYDVSSWRGSKEFVCCKMYTSQSNKALLVWCRAVVSSENVSDKCVQVNLIELSLKETEEKSHFDPSDHSLYRFKKQIIIPLAKKTASQQRFGVQLHPKRPLLFIFSRQSRTVGVTCLELFNFENNGSNIRYSDKKSKNAESIKPNAVYSFGNDYYLSNECLEQNKLHFVTKQFGKIVHEFVLLFHKPEIEQNIQSGSKLVVFDLTEKNMNNFKSVKYTQYQNMYNNNGLNMGLSLNFNSSIWNLLHIGQTYHHNLIDIHPRGEKDENILILFRIHHVKLINQNNAAAPPQSLAQLDPNSDFNFESWSQIYYVNLNLVTRTFSDVQVRIEYANMHS